MIDPANVPEVEPWETLARYVLHSSYIRSSDQTVTQNAFIPHPHRALSVTRHRSATEQELWSVGESIAGVSRRTLYGRADIQAEVCFRQSLACKAAPVPSNPNHADVLQWPADKPAQKTIAQALAASAVFMANPQ